MAVINDTIRGLDPNTRYVVRVRSISKLGVKSEWSEAFEFVTPTDSTVPEPPDNLRVNFETPDLILNWDPPTNNTDGTLVQDLDKYQIILDAGIGSVVYETTSPFFVYSFYQNNQDFASPQPGFSIQIRAIDAIGDASNPLNGTANNIPPLTPLDPPTLQDSFNLVTVLMSAHPDDRDISGFVVEHAQGDNDFAHLETITGDSFTHEVEPGTTNRYRFRSRDVFGQESDPSPESSIDTDPPPNVEDPPETPTGLSGTGGYNEDDGAFIDLEWDPNPDLDLNRYELQYIEDGVGNVPQAKVIAPQDTSYRLTGLEADTTYRLVLYARNHIGLRSDPSNEISVTTDPDTTSPDAPLNAHTTSGVRSIIVRWDSNSEADFKAYELYASQTSGFTPDETNRVFKGISTVFVFSTGQDETWFFRLRAIDQDDNFSDFTAEFSGTSLAVDAGKDIVADNLIASSGLIGGVSISPVELSGGRIRGSEFVVDAAGQIRFQASGSVVWEPGAQGGIELAEEGYVNNSSYREDNTLGFNLDNQGLMINEGFINSRALRIGATLQNVLRHSGFDIDRMVDNGSFTDGTYWAELSAGADYVSTPNGKFLGGALHITNTTGAEIYQDVAFDDTLLADQNFAGSVWAKTETSAASVRVKVTDLDNGTTYFSSWVNVDATAFVRITNTWALQNDTNNLRFIIEVDNDVIVDGAMLSLTDTAIDWEPAPLELPFNYIANAHISDLRVDKLRSGTFRGQQMILEDHNNTDARIANTAGTFQIDQTGASFQNGTISMVGGNGAVFIDDGSLRVVADTETQFYANDTGVFMGGQDADTASLYVDTADNKVYVQSPEDTGNTFLMDPGAPTTDGRVLRLNPGTGDEADDTFYLTKQGEAFFYKGIIGIDGDGTGGFHVNAAGDMWVGNALRDSAPFVIYSNGDVTLDASEVTLVGSGSIIRQSNDNWWIRGDGAAYFGGDATFAGSLEAASGTFEGSLNAVDGTFTGSLEAASGTFTGNLEAAGVVVGNPSGSWHGISLDWASDIFVKDDTGRVLLRGEDSGGTRVLDFDSDRDPAFLLRGNSEFRGTLDADGKVTTGNGVTLGTLDSTWDGLSLESSAYTDIFMMDGNGRTLLRATNSGGTRVLDFDSDASTALIIRGDSEFRGTLNGADGDFTGALTSTFLETTMDSTGRWMEMDGSKLKYFDEDQPDQHIGRISSTPTNVGLSDWRGSLMLFAPANNSSSTFISLDGGVKGYINHLWEINSADWRDHLMMERDTHTWEHTIRSNGNLVYLYNGTVVWEIDTEGNSV